MLNRRHLRIKVLQALYAYFQSEEDSFRRTENELMASIEKMYDLYVYLLLTFGEIKSMAQHRIDENKKKLRPSDQDLNPNLKFVDNLLVGKILENKSLRELSESRKINWVGDEHQEMFRKMFLQIRDSEIYFEHMNNDQQGFESDRIQCLHMATM